METIPNCHLAFVGATVGLLKAGARRRETADAGVVDSGAGAPPLKFAGRP